MSTIKISESVFSDVSAVGQVYALEHAAGLYTLFVGASGNVVVCDAESAPEGAITVTSAEEGEARALCAPLGYATPNSSIRQDGVQRVQLEPADVARRAQVLGANFSVPAGETAQHKLEWSTVVHFEGVAGAWSSNHAVGDSTNFFAYVKSGTSRAWVEAYLGVWPFGEATTSPIDIDIFQFGKDVAFPPTGVLPPLVADGSFSVPPEVGLRIEYISTGAVDTDVSFLFWV